MSIMTNCIFFNLDNNDNHVISRNKYLQKIIKNSKIVENEIKNINIIQNEILNFKSYFYIPIFITKININNENNLIIKNSNDWLFKFENKELLYYKIYLKTLKSSRKYIFMLIDNYKYLLETINKLSNCGIVHGNISFDTVLIDNNKALLVDFRHSFYVKNNSFDQIEFVKYICSLNNKTAKPIELMLLEYLIKNNLQTLSKYNISSIIEDYYSKYFSLIQFFEENIIDNYLEQAKLYYEQYANKSFVELYKIFFSDYFYTWDIYSLSIMYLHILKDLHKHIKIYNKFVLQFIKLLVQSIHPNPKKRFFIENLIEKFDNIIFNCEKSVYKELIKNI
jgi:hypothetical protein